MSMIKNSLILMQYLSLYINTIMGYNPACKIQTCSQNCCNYYGYCPQNSSSSLYIAQCYNYYNLSTGAIVGIAFGVALVVLLLVLLGWKIAKKCIQDQKYGFRDSMGKGHGHGHGHGQQVMTTQNQVQYKEGNKMEVSVAKSDDSYGSNVMEPGSMKVLPPLKGTNAGLKINKPLILTEVQKIDEIPTNIIYQQP